MGIRGDMLSAARKAPARLGPDAAARVAAFLRGAACPDGGYSDRAGRSDLYYTGFAVEGLLALGEEPAWDALAAYLDRFGGGEGLDLAHLASLVRAWAAFPPGRIDPSTRLGLLRRIESFRTADGGYAMEPGLPKGSVYGAFVALGACQDLGVAMRDRDRLAKGLLACAAKNGGFANEPGMADGVTTVSAAAAVLFRELGAPVPAGLDGWLLARHHADGGFSAAPGVPVPDLLSTATALRALGALGVSLDPLREPCLDFVDALWDARGAFAGSPGDRTVDVEHTWYGLLVIGLLA
jgi:hypothetical protein